MSFHYPIGGGGGGSGTVTSISVASANGFSGSVSNPTTTPAITLSTSITGILKGSGGALTSAIADVDYLTPTTAAATYLALAGGIMSGNLDMGTHFILNVINPVNPQDAATKNYVDSFVNGLSWKTVVQAATTTTLPANTYLNGAAGVGATLTATLPGVLTIDGYTPLLNDRLLIQNEAVASHNGIYTITTLGTVAVAYILTRATDNDQSAEMTSATVSVANGSTNMGKAFTQTSAAPTIGTTAINWVLFLNAAYTAGSGLTLTSNIFSLNTGFINTWTAAQIFDSGDFQLQGATSGLLTLNAAAITTPYTITLPPSQGAANTIPVNNGSGILAWSGVTSAMLSPQTINSQVGTTYTFVLTDAQEMVTMSNASPITATVPTNASVAYPIGTQIDVVQIGVGKVTFVAAGGVTISSQGSQLSIAAQYVGVSLKKIATNTWILLGNLIP